MKKKIIFAIALAAISSLAYYCSRTDITELINAKPLIWDSGSWDNDSWIQ